MQWYDIPLKIKLISLFLLLSIVPLSIVGYMAYSEGSKSLFEAQLDSLEYIGDSRELNINQLVQLRMEQAKELAGTFLPRQLESSGINDPEDIARIQTHIESIYEEMQLSTQQSGYEEIDRVTDIAIIGVWDKNGIIVANTNKALIGKKMPDKFLLGVKSKGSYFGGFENDPLTGKNFLIILQAIRDWEDNEFAGAILFKVDAITLNEITQNKHSVIGETGEVYLINSDKYMITESRFTKNAILKQKVDTKTTDNCFKGEETLGIYDDYRGVPIVGAAMYISDLDFCILTEMDYSEAISEAVALRNKIIIIILVVAAIITAMAYLVTMSIIKPVNKISNEAKQMAETGDLNIRATVLGSDEIGQMAKSLNDMLENVAKPVKELSSVSEKIAQGDLRNKIEIDAKGDINILINSFKTMSQNLKELIGSIKKNADTTAAATEELSASSEEVNSSMQQVSTTVQEVANGAQKVSKSANDSREAAEKTSESAKKGSDAASSVNQKMTVISTSTNEGAEKIKTLGQKSNEIGKIVDTIKNISEQTNLLALNAAIEAARAGEAGRGFAVVADEVRKLAEDSGRASEQISDLITSIQKEISVSVDSMEKNIKSVDEGNSAVNVALESFKAIPELIKTVTNSLGDMAAVAEENAAGSEEVSSSVQEVTSAMEQVSSSAQQLSAGAEELRNLVNKFKIDDNEVIHSNDKKEDNYMKSNNESDTKINESKKNENNNYSKKRIDEKKDDNKKNNYQKEKRN